MALKGRIGPQRTMQVKQMSYSPTQKLSDLLDVDTTNREDGSLIIWDSATQSFKVQGKVENPNTLVIGGSF